MSGRVDEIKALEVALVALRTTARGLDLTVVALSLDVAIAEAKAQTRASSAISEPLAYTPETLAVRWGCSGKHVRNLIAAGELAHLRLGGKLMRIPAEAVRTFERQQSIRSDGAPAGPASEVPAKRAVKHDAALARALARGIRTKS